MLYNRAVVHRILHTAKKHVHKHAKRVAHHVVEHYPKLIAVALVLSFIWSEGLFITPTLAATYTTVWTSQGDFESNTAGNGGGISTTTSATRLDTATTPGTVLMGPGTVQNFTDSFTDSSYIDTGNSTAIASGNQLQKTTADTITDLTSGISSGWGTSNIDDLLYHPTYNRVYIYGGTADVGKFGYYNVASPGYTDKSTGISGYRNLGGYLKRIALDSSTGKIYIGAGYDGMRYEYDPAASSGAGGGSNLSTTGWPSNSAGYGYYPIADTVNNKIHWFSNPVPAWVSIDPSSSNAITTYSPPTNTVEIAAFDGASKFYSAAGQGGGDQPVRYLTVPGTTFTTLTSAPIPGSDSYRPTAAAASSARGEAYFAARDFGSTNSYFYVINSTGSGTRTSYSSTLNTLWGASNFIIGRIYYEPGNAVVYISGVNGSGVGRFAKFDPSLGTSGFTNLTTTLSSALASNGTSPVNAVVPGASGTLYFGTAAGGFGTIAPPPATQSAQSNVLDIIDTNIAYATLTKNDTVGTGTVTYQLSNDGGSTWVTATPGVQTNFSTAGSSLKYKISLTGNATVQDVSIAYNGFTTSSLSNLKKDAEGDAIWTNIAWNVTKPSNTQIKFRTRGATQAGGASALYSASWSDYYTVSTTGAGNTAIKANGAGGATNPTYRYMEVEVSLISDDGLATPSISDFTLTHVINGPPNFDATYGTNGVSVTVSTTTDSTWGTVGISYKVRDIDASGGTTPNAVTPSFEYSLNGGSSWSAVNSSYLGASDVSNKTVEESAYTTHSATWNAVGQLGTDTYVANAKIRVTINDNEPVNNTANASSAAFTLDTKSPTISSLLLDASSASAALVLSASDDTTIKDYKVSNNTDMSDDGNGLSSSWQTLGASTLSLSRTWTFASSSTVTAVVRDLYGNISTSTAIVPAAPSNIEYKDISSPDNNAYREFLAWGVYPASATGATFQKYRVFRSTDAGSSYSLLTDITDRAINYYADTSTASTTTYYYKVKVTDSDGDVSSFTSSVNDQPDGQGGSDTTNPTLSDVQVDTIKNTSVRVTWDTDELANSVVNFGLTSGYGSTTSSVSYIVAGHEIYLTGLSPNTLYYYLPQSTDIADNTGAGSAGTFTTVGGPVISNVTTSSISDNSVTIQWNTNTSADSYVNYSTSASLASYTTVGDSALISGSTPFQHRVTIAGLTAGSTYYYEVKSTDAGANTTIDTNAGAYHSFSTTLDTTGPVISNISVPVASDTSAVIVWATDELSDSQVELGTIASTTAGAYASTTPVDTSDTINHITSLFGLTASTPYYFRVKSTDMAGNASESSEQTFTTADPGSVTVVRTGASNRNTNTSTKDTTPPTITAITVKDIVSFSAKVALTVNEPAYVLLNYGESASYGQTAASTALAQEQSISIDGLKPGTTYYYQATVIDGSGNTAVSQQGTFKTLFLAESLQNLTLLKNAEDYQNRLQDIIESALPSISPPFIQSPVVSDITEDSAVVTYKTNIKSYGIVSFATDEAFQSTKTYPTDLSINKEKDVTHSTTLTGLTANTKYHILAKAFVFPEVVGSSPDITFSTKAAQVAATILNVTTDSFRAVWKTIVPATSVVKYTNTATGMTQEKTSAKLETEHDMVVDGLSPRTTYLVNISGATAGGNEIVAKDTFTVKTTVDVAPPAITELKITSALTAGQTNSVQTIISWKTDEPSSSNVSYEEGSGAPGAVLANKAPDTQGLVQNHIVILTNLKQATIYRVQVASTDGANNTAAIPITTIITPKQNESIVDVIFKNFGTTFSFIK